MLHLHGILLLLCVCVPLLPLLLHHTAFRCIARAFCRRAVGEHKPKIVFLTSPNNPDGSVISDDDLLAVLALPVLVVLDEAYIEFCTDLPSRIKWVQKHDNLVVLRTFSKCAALAGMRVGYGAFPLGMIDYLWRAKQPYNVSVAAEVSSSAARCRQTVFGSVLCCAVLCCVLFSYTPLCSNHLQ